MSRRCYVDSIQVKGLPPVVMLDVEPLREQIEPLDMIENIFISEEREFSIGIGLGSKEKEKFVKCLVGNLDVFG